MCVIINHFGAKCHCIITRRRNTIFKRLNGPNNWRYCFYGFNHQRNQYIVNLKVQFLLKVILLNSVRLMHSEVNMSIYIDDSRYWRVRDRHFTNSFLRLYEKYSPRLNITHFKYSLNILLLKINIFKTIFPCSLLSATV